MVLSSHNNSPRNRLVVLHIVVEAQEFVIAAEAGNVPVAVYVVVVYGLVARHLVPIYRPCVGLRFESQVLIYEGHASL